jgi:hypothetical protein
MLNEQAFHKRFVEDITLDTDEQRMRHGIRLQVKADAADAIGKEPVLENLSEKPGTPRD